MTVMELVKALTAHRPDRQVWIDLADGDVVTIARSVELDSHGDVVIYGPQEDGTPSAERDR